MNDYTHVHLVHGITHRHLVHAKVLNIPKCMEYKMSPTVLTELFVVRCVRPDSVNKACGSLLPGPPQSTTWSDCIPLISNLAQQQQL